jgi:uncharacterized protein
MVARFLVALIRIYQVLSRFTPAVCRFRPTCSEYAAQALIKHGAWRGCAMALKRVSKCHPWSGGGYDPVQ